MHVRHALAGLLLLTAALAQPAVAQIQGCRDPSPDERLQLELCSAHIACRPLVAIVDSCAAAANLVRRFFSNERAPLDPGEYTGERRTEPEPPKPSVPPRYKTMAALNLSLEGSRLDRRIAERCSRVQDYRSDYSDCPQLIREAEVYNAKIDAFNADPEKVRLEGQRLERYTNEHLDRWRDVQAQRQSPPVAAPAVTETATDPLGNLPRRDGGSGLANFQQAAGQKVSEGLKPSSPQVQADATISQAFALIGSVVGAGMTGGTSGAERRQAMREAADSFGSGGAPGASEAPEITPTGNPDADCKTAMNLVRPRFEAGMARAADTVQQLEVFMWLNIQAMAVIDRYCPETAMGRGERVQLQRHYAERQRTCNGISSRPCVARLPGETGVASPAFSGRPVAGAPAPQGAGQYQGDVCTPGATYNSQACYCRNNPRGAGCGR